MQEKEALAMVVECLEEAQAAGSAAQARRLAMQFVREMEQDGEVEGAEGEEGATAVMQALLRHMDRVLAVESVKKEVALDRLLLFTSVVVASISSEAQRAVFFAHMLERSRAEAVGCRARACHLIGEVLSLMDADAEISQELWDTLVETLLPRLQDKAAPVRVQAVHACARMQDNEEPEACPVTAAILELMESDTNKDVRKAAVTHIEPSAFTLPRVVARTRDVRADVRKAAIDYLNSVAAWLEQCDDPALVKMLMGSAGDEGLVDEEEQELGTAAEAEVE